MNTILIILRKLHEHQQYETLLETCQTIDIPEPDVLVLQVIAHIHLGQSKQADRLFDKLYSLAHAFSVDTMTDLAAVYMLRGELQEARKWLETVLCSQPEHALAMGRLGWCCMALDEPDVAKKWFEQSLERDGSRLAVWINLAVVNLSKQQFEAAQLVIDEGHRQLEQQSADLPESVAKQQWEQLSGVQLDLWLDSQQQAHAEHWLGSIIKQDNEKQSVHWCTALANRLAQRDGHISAVEVLRQGSKKYPSNVVLLLEMAKLAQVQGYSMQAIQLLRRAIAGDKENPALWAHLAQTSLQHFSPQARNAAEKAITLAVALSVSDEYPEVKIRALTLQAKLALAQVESNAQHFEQAEELFREVLESQPFHVAALRAFGHQQMQRGQIEEAIALYEEVKRIDPVSGHVELINVRCFPEDEATLDQLDKAAHIPALEGSVSTGILFQLAAAWEKRQDYERAFDYVRQANDLSKRFLHYDPVKHRNHCARIRHSFCKELYEHRKDYGIDSTLPVFVLGMPRSGTTLVEQIIAGHSQIFGAGELGVIPGCIQGLSRWERHIGSGRSYPDCVDDLTPDVVEGIVQGILQELQDFAPEAKHIVDKLPHNFENIGLIKFLFPKAKIISVRRDPRDIAVSNYFTDYAAKHSGMGFAYDLNWIGEQLADHNILMHYWQQLFPGEILEVSYEDVVEDTESVARQMLDYIGVPWEKQVLDFNQLERPIKTASVWQVRQPIYKTSKAKWLHYENKLTPLIQGTNTKIQWDPIEMITLPEPGFLTQGVTCYKNKNLDNAESCFKKLLHHIPDHAAGNFMIGLIYLHKHHPKDGIALMEKALAACPWKRQWRDDLIRALEMTGDLVRSNEVRNSYSKLATRGVTGHPEGGVELSAMLTSMTRTLASY